MEYVIIGNSAAAVGAIEGIREHDSAGRITVVSSEPHHVYSRPLISYLLQGKTDEQRMKYRPDDFYEKNKVTAMLGRTAGKLAPTQKTVTLDGGETLHYDRLLVATGSTPFVPPMEGLETVEKCFSFLSLDDAKALDAALFPKARVLIIGAGLIGLKCAEGIAAKAGSLTVIDLAPRILSSILDEEGAALVQKHLEKNGVRFRLGVSVKQFCPGTAVLTNGESIDFDVLVTAVGVRPNVSLVADAGGTVEKGIVVDGQMRTGIPDVWAAGDCVTSFDVSLGARRPLAILPNAYTGGRIAGLTMAGGKATEAHFFPMNAIGFFGLHILTAGVYEGEVYAERRDGTYKKLFYGDTLRGFILIGNVAKAGIYTSLIREQTPLTELDFASVCREPSLIAFSRRYRDEALAGVRDEAGPVYCDEI
ncbi:MAG: NAD(P)/FAD-dependent oxidoreductase [Oscillospiraceae bacterium]|jgi:NAD(P)H-nitrite reductase large subunit